MNVEAVLVLFSLDGSGKTYETSGILFDTNMVLIPGTSLIPLLQQKEWMSSFVKSSSSELGTNEYIEKVFFRIYVDYKRHNGNSKLPEKLYSLESETVWVWKCPLVSESFEKLFFRDWTFGHMNFGNESEVLSGDDIDLSKELMSVFILLRCKSRGKLKRTKENDESSEHIRVLFNLLLNIQKPSRGQEIEVVSTPFGNEYFMNSLSCGVISNVVGCEDCIILSDARTVSGCEGGPIFIAQRSRKEVNPKLLGLVTCPLSWWRGEWVGLTIGISLMPILKRLLITGNGSSCSEYIEHIPHNFGSVLLPVNFIDETVVLIRSKTSWGSGVILNAVSGIIITCSHVVKDDNIVSVFQKGRQYSADVVFKSQNDVAYDLAILKTRDHFLFINEVSLSKNLAKIGELVVAAGFPFFFERGDAGLRVRPSVVSGCVARVNPHMIQTTCCIQSGFSGGALFRDRELLGIIISNAKDSTAGALFPHINFIVPSSVFREPILRYIKTNDIKSLRNLECSDVMVEALWKLQISKL